MHHPLLAALAALSTVFSAPARPSSLPGWLAGEADRARRGPSADELDERCSADDSSDEAARACTQLALRHLTAAGVPFEPKRAALLADRGCRLGDSVGCSVRTWMKKEGAGFEPPDWRRKSRAAVADDSPDDDRAGMDDEDEASDDRGGETSAEKEKAEPGEGPELPDWLAADLEDAKLSLEPDELERACRDRTFTADLGLPCAQLALRRLEGLDVEVDLADGARLARLACTRENVRGCALFGWMREEGIGLSKDGEAAERAYRQSCRASDTHPHGGGCYRLAMLLQARGGDAAAASKALRASCAAQYAPACKAAYPQRDTATSSPEPRGDGGLAAERRRCDAGAAEACKKLGDRAAIGEGVDLSRREAAALFRKACDAKAFDADACAKLGVLVLEGNGVRRDVAAARRLLDRACLGKVKDACARLQELDDARADSSAWCGDDDTTCVPSSGPRSIDGLGRACDRGEAQACLRLASALLDKGPNLDYGGAAEALRKACDGDLFPGCTVLASLNESGYGVPRRDYAASAKLYEQACDGDSLSGCVGLAWALLYGYGVEKDSTRGYELALRACDGGTPEGCQAAAYAVHFPDSGKGDPKRAVALLERGCRAKHPGSCAVLAYALSRGDGAPRDRTRALELARTACRTDTHGCFILGAILVDGTDSDEQQEGRETLELACRAGHTTACKRLRGP